LNSISIQRILLMGIISVLLLTACSEAASLLPVATVDTEEVAAIVHDEVENQLSAQEQSQPPDAPALQTAVDVDAIVETVVARIEEKEEPLEELIPIAFSNETVEVAAKNVESALINIYQRANPAVVFILVPPVGSGSGFVIDEDGYIVTNNHVVENGREYEVLFSSGERRNADLVGQDIDSDLAVLQVDDLPTEVEPLVLGSSDSLVVGQLVAAIGNPFGEQGSMSLGIISGLGRSLQSERELEGGSSYALPQVIQTDAPINPGNSGGPLLNLQAEVIGVNSAIASRTGTNSGVGFSIPVDAVRRIAPSLIESGSYDYPYIGAGFESDISLDEQKFYDLTQTQGAYLLNITEGSPADQAGLIAANVSTRRGGDLIIAIDGTPIEDFADLNSYLVFQTEVGQQINLTLLRGGERTELMLTLGSRP
jgi:2-alkenal reductase